MTTKPRPLPERWYEDACGAAHALELVGERWALLVMRELMFGPRRFSDLRQGLPGISANVLTQRLAGLEASGIVVRRQLPAPANAQVYELTPWGYEAEPILQVMGRWAARSPHHDPSLPLSAVSLAMSLRTMFHPERAIGVDVTVALEIGTEPFVARVSGGAFEIVRGEGSDVDVTLRGAPAALGSVIYGFRTLSQAERDGDVRVEGNRSLAKPFFRLFELPPKVAAPGA